MFSKTERENFKDAVKKKFDIENGIDLKTAFICGYLDVARAPLKGINKILQEGCGENSIKVRDEFIDHVLVTSLNELFDKDPNEKLFDEWHEKICEEIKNYYNDKGYNDFSVGKAQKWINMSLKYASIYCYTIEKKLKPFFKFFHVPIDRYVAKPIVRELRVELPTVGDFKMPSEDEYDTFDADKKNYSWSKIDDYDSYFKCQKEIRKKCEAKNIIPLKWEFNAWNDEKNSK